MGTMISPALQPLKRLSPLTKPSNKVWTYLTWPSLSPFSSPSACSGWFLPDCDAAVPSSWTAQRPSPPLDPAPATSQLSLHLFIHQPAVFTPVHSSASCPYRHSLTPPAVFTGLHSHLCINSQLSLQAFTHTCTLANNWESWHHCPWSCRKHYTVTLTDCHAHGHVENTTQ